MLLWSCEERDGMLQTDGREGREGRVRLRRSSASKAAGILLKPLKKSQNSLTLKQLGFFQQRSLPAALEVLRLLQSHPPLPSFPPWLSNMES